MRELNQCGHWTEILQFARAEKNIALVTHQLTLIIVSAG